MFRTACFLFLYLIATTNFAVSPMQNFSRNSWMIDESIKEFMSSSGDVSELIAQFYIGSIVHGPVTAGINKLNKPRFSSYGWPQLYNNWFLNGFKISDPARSGTPMFRIPYAAWQDLSLRTFQYTAMEKKGIHYNSKVQSGKNFILSKGTAHLGGGFILPTDLFKGDPITALPENKDILNRNLEHDLDFSGQYATGSTSLFVNYTANKINYVHPRSFTSGARDFSILFSGKPIDKRLSYLIYAGYYENDAHDAYLGLSDLNSFSLNSAVGHAQGKYKISRNWIVGSALSIKKEWQKNQLSAGQDIPRNIEFERISTIEPSQPSDNTAIVFENFLEYAINKKNKNLKLKLAYDFSYLGLRYNGANPVHTMFLQGVAKEVLIYSDFQESHEAVNRIKLGLNYNNNSGKIKLSTFFGISDSFTDISGANNFLNIFGISSRVTATYPINNWTIAIGLQLEPMEVNHNLTGFLNGRRPSFTKYQWNDLNGNSLFDEGELGTLYSNHGGKYHQRGSFKTPYTSELYIGFNYKFSKTWSMSVNLLNRNFHNPIKVSYTGPVADSFTANPNDTYDRDISLFGQEKYELSNYDKTGHAWILEIIFLKIKKKNFFLNISGAAFECSGQSSNGNGVMYNDIGVIDELQADPHSQFYSYGRLASDRAYMVKASGGFYPFRNFILAFSMRYRDGEPFYVYQIHNANYGYVKRVIPWTARYLFALNLNIRIAYSFIMFGGLSKLTFDMFNVIGSNTSMKEYAFFDNSPNIQSRAQVEAVPPRSMMFSLKIIF